MAAPSLGAEVKEHGGDIQWLHTRLLALGESADYRWVEFKDANWRLISVADSLHASLLTSQQELQQAERPEQQQHLCLNKNYIDYA